VRRRGASAVAAAASAGLASGGRRRLRQVLPTHIHVQKLYSGGHSDVFGGFTSAIDKQDIC
jgi:hypothetical protein